MKTTLATSTNHKKEWHVIDAKGQVLGRMAVQIANLLRGRHKAVYTPHVDAGDYVVIINADKVSLTGSKEDNKRYMFYSGWMGGESYKSVAQMRQNKPEFIIEHAVKGMLPKNRLGRQMIKKLKIHAGSEHPYQAQKPKPYSVS